MNVSTLEKQRLVYSEYEFDENLPTRNLSTARFGKGRSRSLFALIILSSVSVALNIALLRTTYTLQFQDHCRSHYSKDSQHRALRIENLTFTFNSWTWVRQARAISSVYRLHPQKSFDIRPAMGNSIFESYYGCPGCRLCQDT